MSATQILAFLAASKGITLGNLTVLFTKEVQVAEVHAFYSSQIGTENIHSDMYSLFLESYIHNPTEKSRLFNAVGTISGVDWILRWLDGAESFTERFVAFACIEGIFFSGSFCGIFSESCVKGTVADAVSIEKELVYDALRVALMGDE